MKSTLEGLSFVATAIAIIFLWVSVEQTKNSLRIQQEAFLEQKIASRATDSMTREQLNLLRESNEIQLTMNKLQLDQNVTERLKVVEAEKPILVVNHVDCKIAGDTVELNYNIENRGKSIASNVVAKFEGKSSLLEQQKNSSVHNYSQIIGNRTLVLPQRAIGIGDMSSRVTLSWEWLAFGTR